MPITVIKGPDGVRTLFTVIGSEAITQSKVLQIASGEEVVATLASGKETQVCGVAAGGAGSGELIRVITQGIVSGAICAEDISFGDVLQGGLGISGTTSGVTGVIRPLLSGVGAMLGKALNSGGIGSGIPVLVDLG